MDKAALFQYIVTNAFIPGIDYCNKSFNFETIFYVCGYSYHCCSCAFDHEYMNCISDSGNIEKNVLEKITKGISEGKCPHVHKASKHHVTVTKVNGMHVAAAKGILAAVTSNAIVQQTDAPSGLFGITPYHMAFLKCRPEMLKPLRDAYTPLPCDQFLLYCSRKEDVQKCINMENISLVELCARKNSTELLENFFEIYSNALGLSHIFHHELTNMKACLIRNLDKCFVQEDFECLELALIHDKLEVLDGMLKYVSKSSVFEHRKRRLYALATKLKRERCIELLSKYGPIQRTGTLDDVIIVEDLLEFLLKYPERLDDKLIPLLNMLPKTVNALIGTESSSRYIHHFIKDNFLQIDAKKIEVLFELESQVKGLCASDPAVLHHILYQQAESNNLPAIKYRRIRKAIELCLFHNPCLQTGHNSMKFSNSMIGLSAIIDEKVNNMTSCPLIELDYLTMDGMIHSFAGQNDHDSFALNFIAPLLIEYGVPFTRKELDSIQIESLHPMEQEYLQHCASNPRTLMLRCRDVLRQAFPGGRIRELLGVSNVPKEVKDFILMENSLHHYVH